jgi:hypothetical protein
MVFTSVDRVEAKFSVGAKTELLPAVEERSTLSGDAPDASFGLMAAASATLVRAFPPDCPTIRCPVSTLGVERLKPMRFHRKRRAATRAPANDFGLADASFAALVAELDRRGCEAVGGGACAAFGAQ